MIEIKPSGVPCCTVQAPPSKSYTNRALVIAALADGEARLNNPLFSADTEYMKEALLKFGVDVVQEEKALAVKGTGGNLHALRPAGPKPQPGNRRIRAGASDRETEPESSGWLGPRRGQLDGWSAFRRPPPEGRRARRLVA